MKKSELQKLIKECIKEVLAEGQTMSPAEKETIKKIVQSNSFMSLRTPLQKAGFKAETVQTNAGYAWIVSSKRGGKVVIGNKKMFEPGDKPDFEFDNDIVMGDY